MDKRNKDVVKVQRQNSLWCIARKTKGKYFLVDQEGEIIDKRHWLDGCVDFFSYGEAREILKDIYRTQNKNRVYVLLHQCFVCYAPYRSGDLLREIADEKT